MDCNIRILSMVKREVSEKVLNDCSKLYCNIWREPPWNEEFWKEEDVKADILRDCDKEAADCFVAVLGESAKVVGFTWGYMVSASHLNKISGSDFFTLSDGFANKTFYVDELGVDSQSRGHGIGRHLSEALLGQAGIYGAESLVLRTDEKALAARALYKKLGFNEIPVRDAKYPGRTYWHLKM